jgi:hypothetical protein
MTPRSSRAVANRVVERGRAVALAHHYRRAEGLTISQIAEPSWPLARDLTRRAAVGDQRGVGEMLLEELEAVLNTLSARWLTLA